MHINKSWDALPTSHTTMKATRWKMHRNTRLAHSSTKKKNKQWKIDRRLKQKSNSIYGFFCDRVSVPSRNSIAHTPRITVDGLIFTKFHRMQHALHNFSVLRSVTAAATAAAERCSMIIIIIAGRRLACISAHIQHDNHINNNTQSTHMVLVRLKHALTLLYMRSSLHCARQISQLKATVAQHTIF